MRHLVRITGNSAECLPVCPCQNPITVVQGVVDSATNRRFALASPVWTGITARILAGYKGVHPNA